MLLLHACLLQHWVKMDLLLMLLRVWLLVTREWLMLRRVETHLPRAEVIEAAAPVSAVRRARTLIPRGGVRRRLLIFALLRLPLLLNVVCIVLVVWQRDRGRGRNAPRLTPSVQSANLLFHLRLRPHYASPPQMKQLIDALKAGGESEGIPPPPLLAAATSRRESDKRVFVEIRYFGTPMFPNDACLRPLRRSQLFQPLPILVFGDRVVVIAPQVAKANRDAHFEDVIREIILQVGLHF